MWIVYCVASSAILLDLIAVVTRRWGKAGACGFTGFLAIALGFMSGSDSIRFLFIVVLGVQAFFSFLFIIPCAVVGTSLRGVMVASILAMLFSYYLVLPRPMAQLREFRGYQAQFHFESIADRLSYESKAEASSAAPVLAPDVEERLELYEKGTAHRARSYHLSLLHSETAEKFAMAQGFGISRMRRPISSWLELPEQSHEPVRLAPAGDDDASPEHPRLPQDPQDICERPPATSELISLYEQGWGEFSDTNRLGYIQDREHVAGFASHRTWTAPSLSKRDVFTNQWNVVRLELISLLKHETPVAYVSAYLPQMDQLHGAPTRQLTGFERSSLERLRKDDDVVVDESPGRIRMVGSLRAARNCLGCHSVQRGELLGAFTYELVPVGAKPPRKNDTDSSPPEA